MYPNMNFDPVCLWRFVFLIGSEHRTNVSWNLCTTVHHILEYSNIFLFSYETYEHLDRCFSQVSFSENWGSAKACQGFHETLINSGPSSML